MAIRIRGNAVSNAESYSLHKKVGATFDTTALITSTEGLDFDLSDLYNKGILKDGAYTFAVRAHAPDYESSDFSNEVSYTFGTVGVQYTITYKFMCGSTEIRSSTTETVNKGTQKTFSTSEAPTIVGYTVSSVSPSGLQTINSDITVIYSYESSTAFATKGPYNLFTTTNPAGLPKVNANTIRGWSTAVGCVPSSFPIAGVRLAIHPSNGTSTETFTKCSKVKVALFAIDANQMKQPADASTDDRAIKNKNYTLVAEKEVATDLPMDTTSLVDFVFDTPFVNTENKFLLLTYITETVSAKVINNSKNTWHWVNQNQENEEYVSGDAFYNWYFNNTLMSFDWAQFKAASGNGETYSVAYTLFNNVPN